MFVTTFDYRPYNIKVEEKTKQILKQALPILASAAAAAGLAFAQAIASHAGLCPAPSLAIADVGALGGLIKAGHQLVVGLM